mgnify:FL=1
MSDRPLFVIENRGIINEDGSVSFRLLECSVEIPEGFVITEDMIYNPCDDEPDIY